MNNTPTRAQKAIEAVRSRLITILVWAAIILVIFIVVSVNRANETATEAKLASPSQSVRDAEVRELANDNNLIDALSDTQDPNTDSTSPQNVKSAQIYKNAAASMNRLIDSHSIPDSVAFSNLFLLYKDSDAKPGATLGLAKLAARSDANRQDLVSHLSDGDPDVRSASVDALSFSSGPNLATAQTAAEVVKVIKDAAAQDSAESALTKIGSPSIPFLVPFLTDPDLQFRLQIATMLGTIGDATAIPPLIAQADATPPNPPVRRVALESIAGIVLNVIPPPAAPGAATPPKPPAPQALATARSAAPILVAALDNPNDDSLARAQAALALGRIGSPQAITALVTALGDLDSRVQREALSGIQSVGPPAVPALSADLKSANETVRVAAAAGLGGIGDSTALAAIGPALSDPSSDVRLAAVQGLGRSANPAAVPLLVARLSDSNGFVAGAASNALEVIGPPAMPALIAALGSPGATTPFYASQALKGMGNSAVPAIMKAVQGGSPQRQTWCAVTLGQIQEPQARPILEQLASSKSPSTRWAAQQALAQFGAQG